MTSNRETAFIGRMMVSTFHCGPDQPRITIAFVKFAAILLASCCYWSVASSDEEKPRVRIDVNSFQTCCEHDNCVSYRGIQSKTVYGATCLNWKDLPTSNEWHPDKHPESGLVSNYCRNPGGTRKNAWCFVQLSRGNKTVHWENCAVPNCTATEAETCCDGNCVSYRGKLSTTISGKRCLPWSDLPAEHGYHPDSGKYPQAGLELNYCRNPDANHPIAWCYTKIKGMKDNDWENCVLPYCTAKDTENCCEEDDCTTYRGKLSTTRNGKECLWWKNNAKSHKYYPEKPENQNYGLQNNNYCRNPSNNATGAWCYTQRKESKSIDWKFDWCYLPRCSTVKKNGCTVLDKDTAIPLTKWDHVYCGSGPGDERLYYGCRKYGEDNQRGTCWRQKHPGQDSWCYGGQNGKKTLCNPSMSPVDAGKYCYEKAPRCKDDKDAKDSSECDGADDVRSLIGCPVKQSQMKQNWN